MQENACKTNRKQVFEVYPYESFSWNDGFRINMDYKIYLCLFQANN